MTLAPHTSATSEAELIALADQLDAWHDCASGQPDNGNGHFRVTTLSDSEQTRLNLRATLREAAAALRAASSPARVVADKDTAAVATMVYEAVRFANWAAGEGFTPVEGEPAMDPADLLVNCTKALDTDDFDGLAELARDSILNLRAPADGGWQGEPFAWLVSWKSEGQEWVDAHANELTAIDQAARHKGTITPLYAAPPTSHASNDCGSAE